MHVYLMPGLEAGPRTIRRLIRWIPAEKLDLPTHPDRFTPREVIAHLCDWEPISRGRMQAAKNTPGVTVPDLDEVQIAWQNKYEEWDPYSSADWFIERRAETVEWLKQLSPEDWSKVSVHSMRGPMTIYDYANMELGHDMYHVRQLCEVIEAL